MSVALQACLPLMKQTIRKNIRDEGLSEISSELQTTLVKKIVELCPNERFWICMDPCDVKVALQESMKGEWNGDEDLGNGEVTLMYEEYKNRMARYGDFCEGKEEEVVQLLKDLQADIKVLTVKELSSVKGHIRQFRNSQLEVEAFDSALQDTNTGLTHAALVGLRPQNVADAAALTSYAMADYMSRHGFVVNAEHIKLIAQWNEASDGRGLTQLQRCKFNNMMLQHLVEELMPWSRDGYDFSWLDINRPWDNVRGLSLESLIGITSNITTQELRRGELGKPPEHPRAGTTDCCENFIGLLHHHLGPHFTTKELKYKYHRIALEFIKKMDPDLPYYHPSGSQRFREEDSFDTPGEGTPRLHQVHLRRRDDGSLFVPGRAMLASRGARSIRNQFHKFDVGMPPVPSHKLQMFMPSSLL